jgi:hypothetical protein
MSEYDLLISMTIVFGVFAGMLLCLFFPEEKKNEFQDFEIVGIGGEKLSGKSTMASFFEANGFHEMSFASYLKTLTAQCFNLSMDCLTDQNRKERPFVCQSIHFDKKNLWMLRSFVKAALEEYLRATKSKRTEREVYRIINNSVSVFCSATIETPRQLLQILGTDVLRNCIAEDFHTAILKHHMLEANKRHGLEMFIISDMRFANEREFIQSLGGSKVRIINTKLEVSKDGHASEKSLGELREYDYVFYNEMDDFSLARMSQLARRLKGYRQ